MPSRYYPTYLSGDLHPDAERVVALAGGRGFPAPGHHVPRPAPGTRSCSRPGWARPAPGSPCGRPGPGRCRCESTPPQVRAHGRSWSTATEAGSSWGGWTSSSRCAPSSPRIRPAWWCRWTTAWPRSIRTRRRPRTPGRCWRGWPGTSGSSAATRPGSRWPGDSAGGNLAAGLALRARDAGGPGLVQQTLICPWLDLTPAAEEPADSFRHFGDGPWLSPRRAGLVPGPVPGAAGPGRGGGRVAPPRGIPGGAAAGACGAGRVRHPVGPGAVLGQAPGGSRLCPPRWRATGAWCTTS